VVTLVCCWIELDSLPFLMHMGTQSFTAEPLKHDDERRLETRFGAEGEVLVRVEEGHTEREFKAKLLDFSLHGLRIRMPEELKAGQEVHVFFSWGEAVTRVQWTAYSPKGFESGLQLF
jgi:PilZ domain-containing protein